MTAVTGRGDPLTEALRIRTVSQSILPAMVCAMFQAPAHLQLPQSLRTARLSVGQNTDLPIAAIDRYPLLAAVLSHWDRARQQTGRLPARLDPLLLPREILPYVMLLDLETADCRPLLRIRLAGTEVCAKHGREMKGLTTDDFFHDADAAAVVQAAMNVAASGQPSLASRSYVSIDDRMWSYVRLILPLSRNGRDVDSFFKVADPASMRGLTAPTVLPAAG